MEQLFRFKFSSLEGIDKTTAKQILANKLKFNIAKANAFLGGAFLFKPLSKSKVDILIEMLASNGINCEKVEYKELDNNIEVNTLIDEEKYSPDTSKSDSIKKDTRSKNSEILTSELSDLAHRPAILIDTFFAYIVRKKFLNVKLTQLDTVSLFGISILTLVWLLVGLTFSIEHSIKWSFSISAGLAFFIGGVICHYSAFKFLPKSRELIQSSKTKLSSSAYLDLHALIFFVLLVVSLPCGIYLSTKIEAIFPLFTGIIIFITSYFFLKYSLVPSELNIEVDEKSTSADDILGISSFWIKGMYKLTPVIFFSFVLAAFVQTLDFVFTDYQSPSDILLNFFSFLFLSIGLFSPILGYLIFISYHFIIDIVQAVLSLNSKKEL